MFLVNSKIILVIEAIFNIFIVLLESQVCTKTEIVTKHKRESYTRTYIYQYQDTCYSDDYYDYEDCLKTRVEYETDYRDVPYTTKVTTPTCCDGYGSDNLLTYLNCIPICAPPCENGYCESPDKCQCNAGYELSPMDSHNCLPVCSGGCAHGTCTGPDNCSCYFGYTLQNGICRPICSASCVNGECIAPNTCECLNGYQKSANDTCVPRCSRGCINGTCIEPEKCGCEFGWTLVSERQCVPKCEPSCVYSTCVGPNTCECYEGYVKLKNNICIPYCSEECRHGSCVEPETCTCNPGWVAGIDNKCLPRCGPGCINGTCSAPDMCDCLSGYVKITNNICAPYCSNGCNEGICVEPEICSCNQERYASGENKICTPKYISTCNKNDGCTVSETHSPTEQALHESTKGETTYATPQNNYDLKTTKSQTYRNKQSMIAETTVSDQTNTTGVATLPNKQISVADTLCVNSTGECNGHQLSNPSNYGLSTYLLGFGTSIVIVLVATATVFVFGKRLRSRTNLEGKETTEEGVQPPAVTLKSVSNLDEKCSCSSEYNL